MKKIFTLLILIFLSSCSDSTKVIFLGDSITEAGIHNPEVGIPYNGELVYPSYTGFITLLGQNVGEDIELIGKGIGGDKVSDLLTRYRNDAVSYTHLRAHET